MLIGLLAVGRAEGVFTLVMACILSSSSSAPLTRAHLSSELVPTRPSPTSLSWASSFPLINISIRDRPSVPPHKVPFFFPLFHFRNSHFLVAEKSSPGNSKGNKFLLHYESCCSFTLVTLVMRVLELRVVNLVGSFLLVL